MSKLSSIQAKRIKEIVLKKFPEGDGNFVITSDLNEIYKSSDSHGETSLSDLLDWSKVDKVIDRLADVEKSTHFSKGLLNVHFLKLSSN